MSDCLKRQTDDRNTYYQPGFSLDYVNLQNASTQTDVSKNSNLKHYMKYCICSTCGRNAKDDEQMSVRVSNYPSSSQNRSIKNQSASTSASGELSIASKTRPKDVYCTASLKSNDTTFEEIFLRSSLYYSSESDESVKSTQCNTKKPKSKQIIPRDVVADRCRVAIEGHRSGSVSIEGHRSEPVSIEGYSRKKH